MKDKTILIVDDSYDILEVLHRQLSTLKYRTFQATDVTDAIDILQNSAVDLLITDLKMPGIDGMELVKYASEHFPDVPVLVITGFPSVSGAIEAVKSGAMEYLIKPFTTQELKIAVEKAFKETKGGRPETPREVLRELNHSGLIGHSTALLEVLDLVYKVKNNRATVLITGESGTGKELVARAIHYNGKFAKAPFIPVNCGAIPENLLESELFGFVKGAFTGAQETRAGFFQAADGGTIFLDEIGNASLPVQNRLLRVIQEKEISMIGANKPQKINVRIIAATNNDLFKMTKSGSFREDLYYRLNVISIHTPSLKDRKEDIPLLAKYFIKKYSKEFQKKELSITAKAASLLIRHSWPGNIRELENVIQRAVIMADTEIGVAQLSEYLKMPQPRLNEKHNDEGEFMTLREFERSYIMKVLTAVNNNKTKAAEILGIDRKTLRLKLASPY
ncbi:sigma-54 dependent transcriptional regulator [Fulvivirga kasyanovii]|uniref:Sigma-54-dependent Fis family transcriptional regulator n=1 Tax=Fulvivirga kasyanovii TaxID=396812 RepID=A0ABW9RYY2_9BACT|nr:sigma-54 dependent transcriptional regulator [Fulvivirga kasyanovii]MTI28947.1 sigma-54-dependent Fis family transcriptional regulator [Fulvivirga kasyanovii]